MRKFKVSPVTAATVLPEEWWPNTQNINEIKRAIIRNVAAGITTADIEDYLSELNLPDLDKDSIRRFAMKEMGLGNKYPDRDEVENLLNAEDFWFDSVVVDTLSDPRVVDVQVWGVRGDWKHDHIRMDIVMREQYPGIVSKYNKDNESDGSDYYTSTHHYIFNKE